MIIPPRVTHLFAGSVSDHFLYKRLWLIDFPYIARVAADLESGKVWGFCLTLRLAREPTLIEVIFLPFFEHCRRNGRYVVHAGGVALNGRGALIAGNSRSGKTTLTMHLVQAGFGFLSDDRCFAIEHSGSFEILGFPERVRVFAANLQSMVEFRFLEKIPPENDARKSFWPQEVFPEKILTQARLCAIFFPCWQPDEETRVEVMTSGQALRELLPLTIEPFFPETARTHFHFIGEMVEKLPCFRIFLGKNSPQWHRHVEHLLPPPPTYMS